MLKTRYADQPFDGEGAFRYGARWNSPGIQVAYAAGDSALAVLDVLVHLEQTAPLAAYTLVRASIPVSLVSTLPSGALPADWAASPVSATSHVLGDAWVEAAEPFRFDPRLLSRR